ncbi:acetoacetate--CoA ligase [Candidatus Ichthyocystis hellenicum]|uniref:acetoacetate--CoA ligase n=1 Tax=Candidatus Ichthyocystis hellenicum TaxID=1561003 RepID=UPI000ADA5C3A|nr:acetoacetate--CoA ligase [Candidatus Ichthyocystis hellenicum]
MKKRSTPSRMFKKPLWLPTQEHIESAQLTHFARYAIEKNGLNINNWADFYQWSIDRIDQFWGTVWDFFQILSAQRGDEIIRSTSHDFILSWFPESQLNYAQNLLYRADCADDDIALGFYSENGEKIFLSWRELREQVRVCAYSMRAAGIGKGDRVASILTARPEATVAFLAAASIGAIWCACSPEFGAKAMLDRLGQVAPKLIFLIDGYHYNGKNYDCSDKGNQLVNGLTSLEKVVCVKTAFSDHNDCLVSLKDVVDWSDWMTPSSDDPVFFEQFPFEHPLTIVFTSGTTGEPKCIVHSAGGILLQHLKEHVLHADITRGSRVFYYTTCSWMMWNWLVGSLAAGATTYSYDGYPFAEKNRVFFRLMTEEKLTHVGLSAKWIHHCTAENIKPLKKHDLSSVRFFFSTGSVLSPDGFRYVYENFKKDVCLGSISGGTDILSCFVLSNPILPVFPGEIQCAGLGMSVQVFDEARLPCTGIPGELVCTKPFPSMPIEFWGDKDNERYYKTYFERYPGVWCHGDYCEKTERSTFVILGRSDATLKPSGVRIGTAEIYNCLHHFPAIASAVAIGQPWKNDERIVLFVKLQEGFELDEQMAAKIRSHLATHASPRHVPAKILSVPDVPRTHNSKLAELAVRAVIMGDKVPNIDALDNPEVLEVFQGLEELNAD